MNSLMKYYDSAAFYKRFLMALVFITLALIITTIGLILFVLLINFMGPFAIFFIFIIASAVCLAL